jgi:pyruvate-formate lyase-activating enzyme
MRLDTMTTAVFRTARNLPPTKLLRFIVSTVVPGHYARDIRRLHEQAQRNHDETTLHVLASVALSQRTKKNPTCLHEAEAVLKAFCEQTHVELENALNPHAAAVARILLQRHTGPDRVGRADAPRPAQALL